MSDEVATMTGTREAPTRMQAASLGITVGYLSRLERGDAEPTQPVARLLDLVRRKGLAALV